MFLKNYLSLGGFLKSTIIQAHKQTNKLAK